MIERTFYCDGPKCERHVRTQRDQPPMFLVVSLHEASDRHFCTWDCVLRYGSQFEPTEVFSVESPE